MPALQHLKQLACDRQVGPTETLTFWTPCGVRQFHCRVRRAPAGQNLFVVRVIEEATDKGAPSTTNGVRPAAREVTATAQTGARAADAAERGDRLRRGAEGRAFRAARQCALSRLRAQHLRQRAACAGRGRRHAGEQPDGLRLPELAFPDLDPAGIVENCLAVARPLADQAGLELVPKWRPRTPRIVADEVSLKQMLLNLLTNAIKFARPATG